MAASAHSSLWNDLLAAFETLLAESPSADSARSWLERWSFAAKRVREEQTEVVRAWNADTRDSDAKARHDAFMHDVKRVVELRTSELARKFLVIEGARDAAPSRVLDTLEHLAAVEDDRVASLKASLEARANDFLSIESASPVLLDGQEVGLGGVTRFFTSSNREERRRGLLAVYESRVRASGQQDELFMHLLRGRRSLARAAGFEHFHAFAWREARRTDYTPEDARRFREAVRVHVLPLLSELRERRRERLEIDTVRAWDVLVNPYGSSRPTFNGEADLAARTTRVLQHVDADFAAHFEALFARGDADLDVRSGKSSRLYADYYPMRHQAMLFASAHPLPSTVHFLMHEVGHAYNHELIDPSCLYWEHWAPLEFRELASQSLEVLTLPFLACKDGFYEPTDLPSVMLNFLEGVLGHVQTAVIVDEFQEWLYTTAPEDVAPRDLDSTWMELSAKYPSGIDWTGYEHIQRKAWQQRHVFLRPLYRIEYGFAWIGALRLWRAFQDDPQETVERYKRALALGNTRSVTELYEVIGAPFARRDEDLADTAAFVRQQLETLNEQIGERS